MNTAYGSCYGRRDAGRKSRRTAALRLSICLLILLIAASEVLAHNPGESYLYLQIFSDRITGRFEIELADFNEALELSGTDGEITVENFDERIDFLRQYYLEHVEISAEGRPLPINFTAYEVLRVRSGYAQMSFEIGGLDGVPDVLTFDYSVLFDEDPDHRGFLLVEHNWATGTFANENQISLIFSPSSRHQDFDLTSSGRLRGFLAVVGLGFDHMLLGFDHVLFLLALLLPAALRREKGKWQPVDRFNTSLINVVKIIVSFTVAHSMTLILSAFGIVHLPEGLVEVVIAASVAIAAANILFPLFGDRLWMMVFGLGLFHGFGFAFSLPELGILGEHPGLAILGFVLGIEIGQVVIVAVLLPFLYLLRKSRFYRNVVLPVAAIAMILVASVWVVERAFGLEFRITQRAKALIRSFLP